MIGKYFGGESNVFGVISVPFGTPVPFLPQNLYFGAFWSALQAPTPKGPLCLDPTSSVLKSYVQYCGYRFSTADVLVTVSLQFFFLCFLFPMQREEYMRVRLKYFPPDIIEQYQLHTKVAADGYVYICIQKGMYGRKQAALLAYKNLKAHLQPFGYHPVEGTVGLWAHNTQPTKTHNQPSFVSV